MRREKVERVLSKMTNYTVKDVLDLVYQEEPRKPVAAMIGPKSSTWQELLVVVCDDGTVCAEGTDGWFLGKPIPGTRADMERKK